MKNTTLLRVISVLVLLAMITVALAACDPNKLDGSNFMNSIPDIPSDIVSVDDISEVEDPDPQPGQARIPVISSTNNITAGQILVAGTCEEGVSVTIRGGKTDVTVKSLNGYFMAQVEMLTTTVAVFEAVAFSDTLTESEVRSFEVRYDATAELRVDGNSVTVGSDSYLLFDSVMKDYLGQNLVSQTALQSFKERVNNRCSILADRAGSYPASIVYVLIPNAPTIYNERVPSNSVSEAFKTRYDYVSETLADSKATLIDMKSVFEANKDQSLYQNTDSHLTEYGAYLVYSEICKVLEKTHPDAKARDLATEFTAKTTTVNGGDLAYYANLDKTVFTETVTRYTPKFNMNIGTWEKNTETIASLDKYASDKDAMLIDKDEGAAKNIVFKTYRSNLPCALIYRDANSIPMFDILAERFDTAVFGALDNYAINMTEAQRYSSASHSAVDYIIVIVTENNIDKILG